MPSSGEARRPPIVFPPPTPRPPDPFRSTPVLSPIHPPPRSPDHHDNQPALGRLPKLPFPKFDGDNPRRWRSRCEKYFH
jgi:hypothetical protein